MSALLKTEPLRKNAHRGRARAAENAHRGFARSRTELHRGVRAWNPHHASGKTPCVRIAASDQVDPIIQFPDNSQSLNPYSYILNNPLSGTDPTGYCVAETGTRIKNCETLTVTATYTDGSSETRSVQANPGSFASAAARLGGNGNQSRSMSPTGPGSRTEAQQSLADKFALPGQQQANLVAQNDAPPPSSLSPAMQRLFPRGDIMRAAGEALGADAAYAVGLATGDQALQDTAINGMRENVTGGDGVNAAMMLLSPRGRGNGPVLEAAPAPAKSPTGMRSPSQIDRSAFRTQRQTYWKAEAKANPGNYTPSNLQRMQSGRAPIGADGHPMELHHNGRSPTGELEKLTRTDHRLGDNYRRNHSTSAGEE